MSDANETHNNAPVQPEADHDEALMIATLTTVVQMTNNQAQRVTAEGIKTASDIAVINSDMLLEIYCKMSICCNSNQLSAAVPCILIIVSYSTCFVCVVFWDC